MVKSIWTTNNNEKITHTKCTVIVSLSLFMTNEDEQKSNATKMICTKKIFLDI